MKQREHSLELATEAQSILQGFGVPLNKYTEGRLDARSPINGETVGHVPVNGAGDVEAAIAAAHAAHVGWRSVPAPQRGELIRLFADELRTHKAELGRLISIEVGKILSEGLGEVQEMIDLFDFAVGLSRQLYGLTIVSERARHRMMETWHPLGVVGVITAFNFPAAVWSWNFALAIVCGDTVVWKPSEKTPLTALACEALFRRAAARFGHDALNLLQVLIGGRDIGEALVDHDGVALVSATGSSRMGREVGPRVAKRFGRSLLELGGNNAVVLTPSAPIDLAVRSILFSAVGTAGQRCTTTRRLIVHRSVQPSVVDRLKKAYATVTIGNPLDPKTLLGPLISRDSYESLQRAISDARNDGGSVFGGSRALADKFPDAYYVTPAIVEIPEQTAGVSRETFAPLLYVLTYDTFDQAIKMHNAVPQGLASAVFTMNINEAETFMSATGSDCGIVNVNSGTSGAEIGGAFGGEKETGGGRETGSDAWKAYMRRSTNTINYSGELALAQGVEFGT
jgi:aldehyde dehydrogenase (NAD+)